MEAFLRYSVLSIFICKLVILIPPAASANDGSLALQIGGYIEAYGLYTDQRELEENLRKTDFRKYTEVHLSGEQTFDNGIETGVRIEFSTDRQDDVNTIQESYFYLSGAAGKIILGEEDGAAHLLQVSAPSADELVDGVRPHIGAFSSNLGGTLNYAQDDFGYTSKATYLTPLKNGIQLGVSFTPSVSEGDLRGTAPAALTDDIGGELENGWEFAARYHTSFQLMNITIGAGYGMAQQEQRETGERNLKTWNFGSAAEWNNYKIGFAVMATNNAADTITTHTWVTGGAYQYGPYQFGLSWLKFDVNNRAFNSFQVDRWTTGLIYEWAPGITFRNSIQFQSADNMVVVSDGDIQGYQILLGTMIKF